MPFIAWIILGLLAGFLGSKIANRTGKGVLLDLMIGVAGALLGGFIFEKFSARGASDLNLWSLSFATSGAVFLVIVFHTFRRLKMSNP